MIAETLKFVILHHTNWPVRGDHYDLLLESRPGDDPEERTLIALATLSADFPDGISHADLRTRGGATGNPLAKVNLLRLQDLHRRCYLDFEGPVAGERGTVKRVEQGQVLWEQPLQDCFQAAQFELKGERLKGGYRLRHMGGGTYVFERLKRLPAT